VFLIQVGAGVADLVIIPVQQYRKKGHILRGIKDGASAFLK
jgi:autophagy-related protein 2